MAAADLAPALLAALTEAGRAGDVIHLLVRRVAHGGSGGRPRSPQAGGAQGETGGGRWREKERGGGRRRREGGGRWRRTWESEG